MERAVFRQGYRSRDQQDVVPPVLFDGLLERRLGGVSGRRHQRVLVIQRDQVQDQVADGRVRAPQDAFYAAGALLQLEPYDGGPPDLGQRLHDPGGQ